MFTIRLEKVEELKQGRTVAYISRQIGYARPYVSDIFNGKRNINGKLAEKIIKACYPDVDKPIEDFFKLI